MKYLDQKKYWKLNDWILFFQLGSTILHQISPYVMSFIQSS